MITYDLEADGLYEDATTIHCLCVKVGDTLHRFYDLLDINILPKENDKELNKYNIFKIFNDNEGPIICHNQLGYDIWMLRKFLDIDLIELFGYDRLVDTFVWSQALFPDRQLPLGCPTTIKMSNGQGKKVGPHGLESWGYRVSRKKPSIHDWSEFNNDILLRCEEDVLINEKTYFSLCKERGDL